MSGNCKDQVSKECILRHEQQEQIVNDVKEMKEALVGNATHQEDSLVSKVNILIGDMDLRNRVTIWLASIFTLSIIGAIFGAGVFFNRMDNLEKQVAQNTANIDLILKSGVLKLGD